MPSLRFLSTTSYCSLSPRFRKAFSHTNYLLRSRYKESEIKLVYPSSCIHLSSSYGFQSRDHGDDDDDAKLYSQETFASAATGASKVGTAKFWIKRGIYLKAIMLLIDPNFKMGEFVKGAQQAFQLLITSIDSEDYDSLEGLVSSEARHDLEKLKRDILPARNYTISAIPETCGIIMEDEDDEQSMNRRWFEIVMSFFYMRQEKETEFREGLGSLGSGFQASTQLLVDCSAMLHVKFIREYTKGVDGEWTVNKIELKH